jgi:hypothetical protein
VPVAVEMMASGRGRQVHAAQRRGQHVYYVMSGRTTADILRRSLPVILRRSLPVILR